MTPFQLAWKAWNSRLGKKFRVGQRVKAIDGLEEHGYGTITKLKGSYAMVRWDSGRDSMIAFCKIKALLFASAEFEALWDLNE